MTATTSSATTKTSQLQIRVNPDQKRMIAAAAHRAGMDMSAYVLERVLGSSQRRIQEIARLISDQETRRYGYAELHDLLMSLSTPELQRAIGERAFGNLPPDVENYVAAMIEQACIQRRIGVPSWIQAIPPLSTPIFGSALGSLRLHLLTNSPPPFRRRNVFIDTALGGRV